MSPVEFGIAARYLRARSSTRFASFITGASTLGVAIGVAALITILSVMNGFEAELRDRLLGMQAQATISAADGPLTDWQTLVGRLQGAEGVTGAAPVVSLEGMANVDGRLVPVLVEGLAPEYESRVSDIADSIVAGSLDGLQPGSRRIILGRYLSLELGVIPGDELVLLIPRPAGDLVEPLLRRFVVSGIFDSGVPDYDAGLALVNLEDAAELLDFGDGVSAVKLRFDDIFAAGTRAAALRETLGPGFRSSDWTVENASYFRAIKLEKAMMVLILSLVIAVAAFNIVASLVMVVTDKETDIAILRTLGLRPSGVMRVFVTQGVIIGWLGVVLGIVLGVTLSLNVSDAVRGIESLFGFQIMPGDVYVMSVIPSELKWRNVAWIGALALLLTTLSTLYPARRAAAVHPAQALRYG
jgi:lipoprotein-releasing system permease protein